MPFFNRICIISVLEIKEVFCLTASMTFSHYSAMECIFTMLPQAWSSHLIQHQGFVKKEVSSLLDSLGDR